jgi:hypothetical protein
MVAKVTVKTNSVRLSKEFKNIQRKFPSAIKRALANVSAFQIRNIRTRTEKGISVNGSRFTPYSRKPYFFNTAPEGATPRYKTFQGGYAQFRAFKGRQASYPDLNFSGRMFSSLTSRITPSKGTLFFRQADANKKAYYHDVAGAGKTKVVRPFFSINDKEADKIGQLFADKIFKDIGL